MYTAIVVGPRVCQREGAAWRVRGAGGVKARADQIVCEKAAQIIAADRSVRERRYAIERKTFVLIATQQPMVVDLRTLAAVLEIATELERMGDYAKGIAKIAVKMGTEPFVKPLVDIPRMISRSVFSGNKTG